MAVQDEEALVRALHEPFWDEKNKRATKSAFTQTDVSVSRIGIISYDEIVAVLQNDLNTDIRRVGATATLTAGSVRSVCSGNLKADVVVEVVEDPILEQPGLSDNPSHALIQGRDRATRLIPKRITDGMAKELLRNCEIRIL